MKKLLKHISLAIMLILLLSSCGSLAFLNPFAGNQDHSKNQQNLSKAESFWKDQKIFVDNSTEQLLKVSVVPGIEGKKELTIYDESVSRKAVEIDIPSVFTKFSIDYVLRINPDNYYLIGNFAISIGKSSGRVWKIVLLENASKNPKLKIPDAEAETEDLKVNVLTVRNNKFPSSWQPIQMDSTGWLYFINTENKGLYAFDYEQGEYYRLYDSEKNTLRSFDVNDYYVIINNLIIYSANNKIYVGKLGETGSLESGEKIKNINNIKELYTLSEKVSYPISLSKSGYLVYLDNSKNISKLKYINLNDPNSKDFTELKLFTSEGIKISKTSEVSLGGTLTLSKKNISINIPAINSVIYSENKTYILFSELSIKYDVKIILDYKVQIPLIDQNSVKYYAVLVIPHNSDGLPLFTKKELFLFEKNENEKEEVKMILNKHYFALMPFKDNNVLMDGSYIKRFDLNTSRDYSIEFKKVQESEVKDAADINLRIEGNMMKTKLMTPINLNFEKVKNIAVMNKIPYKFKEIDSKFSDDFGVYMYFSGLDIENKPLYGIIDLTNVNSEKMVVIRLLNSNEKETLKRQAIKMLIEK
ncbi:hypothetical protein X275_04110 [Marinitoga sp. 1197]|uniref:hypothetical protein n=1 Tax=Marinitoga sp. 1197 TaxID=1428449 RepID=UPI000640C34A|nr:hypothetical protein [Marinitoga sp. 1197]KLO23050.1 hypothetical protein X275_04110 [Marinitoga sp. 1197]